MKFKYTPVFSSDDSTEETASLPLLKVTLRHGRKHLTVDCLVDSGASETLLNEDIAELLDIDLSKGETQQYSGIGENTIVGRRHELLLKVSVLDDWISINAGFVAQNDIPLLGHSGFFESFDITFRAHQKRFEIKRPKSRPN